MQNPRRITTGLLLAALLPAAACSNVPDDRRSSRLPPIPAPPAANAVVAEAEAGARLIIKFNQQVQAADDPRFLRSLSDAVGAELVYVRAMAGEAHVYLARGVESDDDVRRLLQNLAKRADIAYAQVDSKRGVK